MSFWYPEKSNAEPSQGNNVDFWGNSVAKEKISKQLFSGPRDDSTLGIITNTITGIPKAGLDVAKDIGQTIARSVGTVGVTAGNLPTQIVNKVSNFWGGPQQELPFAAETPTTGNKFTNALFGGQPIRTLASASENAKNKANELASAVVGHEVTPVGNLGGAAFAIGGTLLDLTGWGGKAGVKSFTDEIPEAFLKYVARETDDIALTNTLKTVGLDDVNAKALADQLAPTKTVDEAKDILVNFGKQTDEVAPKALVENTLETEAPNYKSAEEYVKSQGQPLYHGTNSKFDAFDITKAGTGEGSNMLGKGIYLGKTVEKAKEYGNNIVEAYLKPDAKIVEWHSMKHDPRYNAFFDKNEKAYKEKYGFGTPITGEDRNWLDHLKEDFAKKYFDAVSYGEKQVIVLNPDAVKTKAQLTDIYNKAINPPKQVSEVDRLIAAGKVRVVSRDGRDVYQYQKGKEWVNARDEDSVIKQVTKEPYVPKPKVYTPKDQQKIDTTNEALSVTREQLKEHPARALIKFEKEGEFQDFRNPDHAKNEKERQQILAKNKKIIKAAENSFDGTQYAGKFDDPDAIRGAIEDYRTMRQYEKGLVEQKKDLENTLIPVSKESKSKADVEISPIDVSTGEGRSIEIQARQAQEILKGEDVPVNVSLPKIIENTMTGVNRKVHFIDTWLTTPHFVMEKIGFGKEAEMLRDAADAYWKELPKNIEKISEWAKGVSKESNVRIFRYLDGEALDLTDAEQKIADEIKTYLADWAKRLKLEKENTITHYITHIFDKELLAKEFDEDLAKIIADKIPGSVYDPFLLKRLGAKGYKQDTFAALEAYVKRATRKVHMDPVLERIQSRTGSSLDVSPLEKSQFNYIKKYIDNINLRPSEAEEGIDNFIKSMIGYKLGQRPVTSILKFFRQLTFRGMLGLNPASALRNLSQGANTFAVLGPKYTGVGYTKLFSKGSGEELIREGVLNTGFVQDRVLSATKKALEKGDKALFYFFDRAEKINRGAAYFGAKAKALKAGVSEDQAIKYAKGIVRKTQFVFDTVDTPVGMSSDLMKTLLQFQTFTTKQIEFLTQMAKNKNYMGLLRYAIAGTAFVYTIGRAFGMEPKDILPWYRFETPPSLKFPVEVTKAALNTPDKYGRPRDLKKKLEDVGKAGIGLIPGGSQIRKTVQGLKASKEGGSFDKGGNLQFEVGSTRAEKIQSILFGKYANPEAKDYFEDLESSTKVNKGIKRIYDRVQELDKLERGDEAQALVDNLTEEEYEEYKKIRSAEKTNRTNENKRKVLPIYQEVKALDAQDRGDEAQALVDALSDEEYDAYLLVKKELTKKVSQVQAERSFVELVSAYAKAYTIDPANAFKAMTTREKLGKVEGNLVELERFFGNDFRKAGGSQEYKKKLLSDMGIPESEIGNYKLEHIVPVSAGGDNSPDNLKIVDTATHDAWTKVDIAIGQAVKDKKITRKIASNLAIDFKAGVLSEDEVYNRLK